MEKKWLRAQKQRLHVEIGVKVCVCWSVQAKFKNAEVLSTLDSQLIGSLETN